MLSATATPAAVTWSWEISDADGNPVKTATDAGQFAFAFPQAGTFTVKLTVSDGAGQKAEAKLEVQVTAPPPALEVALKSPPSTTDRSG